MKFNWEGKKALVQDKTSFCRLESSLKTVICTATNGGEGFWLKYCGMVQTKDTIISNTEGQTKKIIRRGSTIIL